MVKPVPDGYHSVTPYLCMKDADKALEFYKQAFGARELNRFEHQGKIGHAEVLIGNSPVMLSEEYPDMGCRGPQSLGGSPVVLCVYVEDVDAVFKQAVTAGGKELRPVKNQFYGDRSGTLVDPFGHVWTVSTHVEDVSPEEMTRRAQAEWGSCG